MRLFIRSRPGDEGVWISPNRAFSAPRWTSVRLMSRAGRCGIWCLRSRSHSPRARGGGGGDSRDLPRTLSQRVARRRRRGWRAPKARRHIAPILRAKRSARMRIGARIWVARCVRVRERPVCRPIRAFADRQRLPGFPKWRIFEMPTSPWPWWIRADRFFSGRRMGRCQDDGLCPGVITGVVWKRRRGATRKALPT